MLTITKNLSGCPLFVAFDKASFNFIHRFGGISLLFNRDSAKALNICFARETWVLYARTESLTATLQLARYIQLAGATKVLVMQIAASWLQEVKCV